MFSKKMQIIFDRDVGICAFRLNLQLCIFTKVLWRNQSKQDFDEGGFPRSI